MVCAVVFSDRKNVNPDAGECAAEGCQPAGNELSDALLPPEQISCRRIKKNPALKSQSRIFI